MSQQVDIKLNGAKVNPNTVASAIYDAARDQALSASLINLIEKNALGYPAFSTLTAYPVGDKVFYDRKLWKFVQAHAAGAWNAQHVQEFSIKEYCDAIDEKVDINYNYLDNRKANIDGYYETMVVGVAKNLEGHNITEGSFFARPSGGEDAELANGVAQLQTVKGNSVKYNQLVQNGNFSTIDTWNINGKGTKTADNNIFTLTIGDGTTETMVGIYKTIGTVVGHKYYIHGEIKTNNNQSGNLFIAAGNVFAGTCVETNGVNDTFVKLSGIVTPANVNLGKIYIGQKTAREGVVLQYKNVYTIDLTAIFGSGNEPSTAAEFEAWLAANWGLQEYYPFSNGSVLNVNMTGLESFKRNLLNPTTGKAYILGAYSETYGNYYGICGTYGTLTFKDAYGNESTITPDADGKFELNVAGELTVADAGADCAVFLWWDGTETEYSEYGTSIAKLDISHIYGKLNGAGELVRVWPTGAPGLGTLQDYLKEEDGDVVAKRILGEVDLGMQTYDRQPTDISGKIQFVSQTIADMKSFPNTEVGNIISALQCITSNNIYFSSTLRGIGCGGKKVRISLSEFDSYTAAQVKTAMSGVMLYYQLATPEIYTDLVYMNSELFEDGTPVTLPVNYEADNWGIERVLPLNTPSAMVTSAPTVECKYSLDAVEQLDTHSAEIADLYDKNTIMDAKKANTDGSYETLVSGAAMNLVGRGSVGAEYRFRPTAGSGSAGSGAAKITKMLGNTLVWNQLIKTFSNADEKPSVSGITYTDNGFTLANAPAYTTFRFGAQLTKRVNHKLYVHIYTAKEIIIQFGTKQEYKTGESKFIYTVPSNISNNIISIYNNVEQTNVDVHDLFVIDLTLMFGAGNEPTAAQFEAMYPLSYYAYNAGTLINNEATGIKTVGFNILDESKFVKGKWINPDGEYVDYENRNANPEYIRVLPSTKYDLYCSNPSIGDYGLKISFYDANKNFVNEIADGGSRIKNYGYITTPSNAYYIRCASPNATLPNFCVNLSHSGDRRGEYEPYWENILALNLKTLTGKLNGEGESVIVRPNGLEAVGTTADEGIVEGGNLTKINVKIGNQVINGAIGDTITLEGCKTSATSFLCASDIGTLSDGVLTLTAAATNVEVYYPLAQPRTYILDTPVLVIYREDGYGTEERLPEDTDSAVTAPIKYEVAYPMDAVGTLTDLPDTYVSGKESQEFTSTEKEQARQNIGAASLADVESMFATLPTTDPQVAGKLWNDNGTVKISAGE